MIVYLATSPSGKHYVGITSKSLKKRISAHLSRAKNGSKNPIHRAIQKYGNSMKWQILREPETWKEACELECGFIALFNSTKRGYNVTHGGDGILGVPCPKHVKIINSKFHTGRKDSSETQQRKALARGAKPFLVFQKETNEFIGEWLSQHKCARDLILKKEQIWKCLNKLRLSSRGYTFQYKGAA